MKKSRSFTLIELLVVIAIIGILAAIVLVAIQSVKAKAKEARRKAELAALARVLDQYFLDKDKYPESNSSSDCSSRDGQVENINNNSCLASDLRASGLQGSMPVDPSGGQYTYQSDGDYYVLKAPLENGEDFILASGEGSVLVIVNDNSSISKEVGAYYRKRRQLSSGQVIHLRTTTSESIYYSDYESQIKNPIKDFIEQRGLKGKTLYLVTTYGIPYKVVDTNHTDAYGSTFSVDSYLADLYDQGLYGSNPYNKTYGNTYVTGSHKPGEHFNSTYGIYLVMRLDGPSAKIAKGLVDKALYAGKYTGPATGKGYMAGQAYLQNAPNTLCGPIETAGYECIRNPNFVCDTAHGCDLATQKFPNPLWHVFSGGYPEGNNYKDVWGPWPPGAVPMNFRSGTAVRTIRDTNDALVVPNYLAADVTATWGVVAEPYATLIPQPTALYDYFLNGHFNLAESTYMATAYLKWRWFAVGDPLYTLPEQPATDNEKPSITNVVKSPSGSMINISWDNFTSENGSPEVTYGCVEYSGGQNICDESALVFFGVSKKNYLSQHSVSIPSGATNVKIKAIDLAGNESIQNIIL